MKIKKGTKLLVDHQRKGKFLGKATRDFNTKVDTFYPIELAQEGLGGILAEFVKGDPVPCRNDLCTITTRRGK